MDPITLVKDAIHRPDEPRHFTQYAFPDVSYTATIGEHQLARTSKPLVLSEVGYAIYPPVVYFPLADVAMAMLEKSDKTTHCPLKGDTEYYDFVGGSQTRPGVGWRYARPLDFAAELEHYIAFDGRKVHITAL